jgi:3-hydroxybutyryl-CoA dehydrogenase
LLLKKVGIIGAGMMGAEIALCFAKAGYEVVMSDVSVELAAKGKARQASVLDRSIQKGKFDAAQKEPTLSRVIATDKLTDMTDCDLVIEAVLEDFEIKSKVFASLDSICKEECVIASNTSSISITKLATEVNKTRAKKFLGTHFFSPATVMKLVEVIPGYLCAQETVGFIKEVLQAIGKTPVEVKDVTGFVVNRLFHVLALEACRLLEEGVASAEDIDTACMLGLGHPMGPLKLLDLMGHDLNIKVDEVLFSEYGERFRPSQLMRKLVNAGLYGKKTGEGFYQYNK